VNLVKFSIKLDIITVCWVLFGDQWKELTHDAACIFTSREFD
jgi:hypothetical protein